MHACMYGFMSACMYVCMFMFSNTRWGVCILWCACMYVCMYVMYVRMYVWMYTYIDTCMHTYTHTYINVCRGGDLVFRDYWLSAYIFAYKHTCMHAYNTCVQGRRFSFSGLFTFCIHTYIHTYIYTYIHTMHVCRRGDLFFWDYRLSAGI